MNALVLTLFVSGGIVAIALIGFFAAYARGENEHAERLRSLPLDDDNP